MQTAQIHRQHSPIRPETIASVLVILLVLSPAVQNRRENPSDGFPLSYFPMFTNVRDGRTTLRHPVGIRPDGSMVDLNYRVAGSGGMNTVRHQINDRVRDDEEDELCREIAETVEDRWLDDYPDIVAVAIVRDRYRFDEFFAGDREPHERRVLARVELDDGADR